MKKLKISRLPRKVKKVLKAYIPPEYGYQLALIKTGSLKDFYLKPDYLNQGGLLGCVGTFTGKKLKIKRKAYYPHA